MKKILLVLMSIGLFILVACQSNFMPPLKKSDQVELTLAQKLTLLNEMNLSDVKSNALMISAKGDFKASAEPLPNVSNSSNKVLIQFEFDASAYISLGNEASESIMYFNLNKLLVNNEQKTSYLEYQNRIEATKSFLLLKNGYVYAQLNGSYKTSNQGNPVEESFNNKQMRSKEVVFTQNEYEILKSMFDSLEENLHFDISDSLLEQIKYVDKMITVYKTGDIHTIRLLITKEQVIEFITTTTENLPLPPEFKDYLKKLTFELRIELNQKKLSKIYLASDLLLEYSDSEMKNDVTLNGLQFMVDFNPVAPTIPSDSSLDKFEPRDNFISGLIR
ncbi:hypothetical protein [Acholeplasma hippikon]|nr:hypothetical protein [Acholeplasma hippikon]